MTNAVKTYTASTYNKNYAATPDFDNTTANKGLSGGMIVLIVIAVLVGVLAIGVLVGLYFMKTKGKKASK